MAVAPADPASRAVFLSYASQDAGAARRIGEALRAAGVEVWFDQSELRGGDAWDAKIRRRIKECALFVPVISAHTQARAEGYFRLEWKLAVDRSHLMADDAPFIVPVVIDDTAEPAARVPDKFRDVQWTRLEMTETPAAFAERLRDLLRIEMEPGRPRSGWHGEGAAPPRKTVTAPGWRVVFPVAAVAIGLVYALRPLWKPSRPPAPVSEARELVARARALYDPWDGATREDFALAEQLVKRAIDLGATDAESWAAYGVIACAQIIFGHDRSPARHEMARTAAERAVKLAPGSNQARFAQAFYFRFNDGTSAEAERMLRELVVKMPGDKLVLRTLGSTLRNRGRLEEALAFYDRAAALPGGDPVALYNKFLTLNLAKRHAEAEAAVDQSLALKPSSYSYRAKAMILMMQHGDLDGAAAALAKMSPAFLLEDSGAYWASRVWLWRREPDKVLAILAAVARDVVGSDFEGPTAFLAGQAHQIAGRIEAARAEWVAALRVAERQLGAQPNSARWLYWKARLLACLDQKAEAGRVLRVFEEMSRLRGPTDGTIPIYLLLDRRDDVLAALETWHNLILAEGNAGEIAIVRNHLRFDPAWDALRGVERFEALRSQLGEDRAALEARPKK